MNETEIMPLDSATQKSWEQWTSRMDSPVPVRIDRKIWETLVKEVELTADPVDEPRVFRLFMKRRVPRQVVNMSRIEKVWRTERGIIRWKEEGYPPLFEPLRKGGNAFIRGDVQLRLEDAWWMGREQTDLRILFARKAGKFLVSAWWARGGTGGLDSTGETNGELRPVRLLIGE